MILTLLLWLLMVLIPLLFYTVDDDQDADSPKEIAGYLAPRYGGVPIILTQRLAAARESGDTEVQSEVHQLRKQMFRNRRTSQEQAEMDVTRKNRFIEKYGKAAKIALRYDEAQKKARLMTTDQQHALIEKLKAEAEAEEEAAPAVTPKKATKKGSK